MEKRLCGCGCGKPLVIRPKEYRCDFERRKYQTPACAAMARRGVKRVRTIMGTKSGFALPRKHPSEEHFLYKMRPSLKTTSTIYL